MNEQAPQRDSLQDKQLQAKNGGTTPKGKGHEWNAPERINPKKVTTSAEEKSDMKQSDDGLKDVKTTTQMTDEGQKGTPGLNSRQGSGGTSKKAGKKDSQEDMAVIKEQADIHQSSQDPSQTKPITLEDAAEEISSNLRKIPIIESQIDSHGLTETAPADNQADGNPDEEVADAGGKQERYEIAEKTKTLYIKLIKAMERYSHNLLADGEFDHVLVSPVQMVEHMTAREDLTSQSKRTYRAAAIWWFKQLADEEPYQEALKKLDEWYEDEKIRLRLQRAKKVEKKRSVPEEDFDTLTDSLRKSRSEWARKALMWVEAGMITGLRPIEWLTAEWGDEEKTFLIVKNAKIKASLPGYMRDEKRKGYKYEPVLTRTIQLDEEAERIMVEEHMLSLEKFCDKEGEDKEERFTRYYELVRVTLNRECKKIWDGKKSYTLYDMRRQFSANMKAEFGRDVAAKRMGHSSPNNKARGSYGLANQAYPKFKGKDRPSDYTRNDEGQKDQNKSMKDRP